MATALYLDLSLRCTGYAVVAWPVTLTPSGSLPEGFLAKVIGDVPVVGEIKLERSDISTQERVGMLALVLGSIIETYRPEFVASEMPSNMYQSKVPGRSVSSASSVQLQQKAFGAVMALCWARGVPFIEVDPAWSKQALTGKRSADKQLVARSLAGKCGIGMNEKGKYVWPKGWTEAVRDALAVLFYIEDRRNVYGNPMWIGEVLEQQQKPLAWHHDRRNLSYRQLANEVLSRHKVGKSNGR